MNTGTAAGPPPRRPHRGAGPVRPARRAAPPARPSAISSRWTGTSEETRARLAPPPRAPRGLPRAPRRHARARGRLGAAGRGRARADRAEEAWASTSPATSMSPYCPGRALAECPSPQADQLRLWILEQARAGASREQVEAQLFQTFGTTLQAPRAEGSASSRTWSPPP